MRSARRRRSAETLSFRLATAAREEVGAAFVLPARCRGTTTARATGRATPRPTTASCATEGDSAAVTVSGECVGAQDARPDRRSSPISPSALILCTSRAALAPGIECQLVGLSLRRGLSQLSSEPRSKLESKVLLSFEPAESVKDETLHVAIAIRKPTPAHPAHRRPTSPPPWALREQARRPGPGGRSRRGARPSLGRPGSRGHR